MAGEVDSETELLVHPVLAHDSCYVLLWFIYLLRDFTRARSQRHQCYVLRIDPLLAIWCEGSVTQRRTFVLLPLQQ